MKTIPNIPYLGALSSVVIASGHRQFGAKSYWVRLYTQAKNICYSPIFLAYILLLRIHGCLCHYLEAMPKDLSPVIQQLIRWRKNNDLSQSEAVRILEDAGLPVKLGTLQHWEIGRARPHPLSAAALAKFLEQQPYLKSSPSPDNKGATPKSLPHVVQQLVRWRASNQLSQSEAVRILANAGLPISVRTLQSWEIGRRSPQAVTAAALTRYLEQHPNIKATNPRE